MARNKKKKRNVSSKNTVELGNSHSADTINKQQEAEAEFHSSTLFAEENEKQVDIQERSPLSLVSTNLPIHKDTSVGLGGFFALLSVMFFGLFFAGKAAGSFGDISVSLFSFWPFLLIVMAFSLFRVHTGFGKLVGFILVFLAVPLTFGLITKSSNAITILPLDVATEEVKALEEFSSITADIVSNIIITKADTHTATLRGDEAILQHVSVTVDEGELKLVYDNILWRTFLFDDSFFEIVIATPELSSLHVDGKGTVLIDRIDSEDFTLVINGNADVTIDEIIADKMTVTSAGLGEITVQGVVHQQLLTLLNESVYNGFSLVTNESAVAVSDTARAYVTVNTDLFADINDFGVIHYKGDPKIELRALSEKGSIKDKN